MVDNILEMEGDFKGIPWTAISEIYPLRGSRIVMVLVCPIQGVAFVHPTKKNIWYFPVYLN